MAGLVGHRRVDRRIGFTLVEVLVAMTVTAVGMTAVFGALRTAGDAAGRLREQEAAERLAESHMVSLLARSARDLQPADGVEGKYTWAEKVESVSVPDVARLVVTVEWQSRGRPLRFELVSMREMR
jgi:type II secretion system protein I